MRVGIPGAFVVPETHDGGLRAGWGCRREPLTVSPGCAPGGSPVGCQVGDGIVKLLGPPALGDAHFAVEGEACLAGQDDEALFLGRVDVLGNHATWHAASAEADELPAGVLADGASQTSCNKTILPGIRHQPVSLGWGFTYNRRSCSVF
jgi:hypothetical protein